MCLPIFSVVACTMKKVSTKEIINDEKVILSDQPLPFSKLLSYADALDYTLMAFASLGSIIHGLAQPLGYLLLGKAIDAFGTNIHNDIEMVKALKKVSIYTDLHSFIINLIISLSGHCIVLFHFITFGASFRQKVSNPFFQMSSFIVVFCFFTCSVRKIG